MSLILDIMYFASNYPVLFGMLVAIFVCVALYFVLTKTKKDDSSDKTLALIRIEQYAKTAMQNQQEESKFQEQIMSDFGDFNVSDAIRDVKTFVSELFEMCQGKKEKFELSNVASDILLDVEKIDDGEVTNVNIFNTKIESYVKNLNSATITFSTSVNYAVNNCQFAKRYMMDYTLSLRDEFGAKTFLKCSNCGAEIGEFDGICKYCGARHVRDTVLSWVVTSAKEI